MAKDKSEFSAKEIEEARQRITNERESSVIISRRRRLANAAGMGDIGPNPTTGEVGGVATGTTGTTGGVRGSTGATTGSRGGRR